VKKAANAKANATLRTRRYVERLRLVMAALSPLAFGAVLFALLWFVVEDLKPGSLMPGQQEIVL